MPVIPGVRTMQQEPIYDRLIVAVATLTANPMLFFTLPIGSGVGQNAGPKQIWDTNLNQAQQLPYGKDFLVRALRFMFQPGITWNDARQLLENYVARFYIGDKVYWEGPLPMIPGGAGLYGSGQLPTAYLALTTGNQSWTNGKPDPRAICVLDLPIRIANGENFRVELQGVPFTTDAAAGTVFGTGLNMRLALDGEVTEPAY